MRFKIVTLFLLMMQLVCAQKNDLARQENTVRRDPSDIIKVNDTYYVYYTYMDKAKEQARIKKIGLPFIYPEGYHGDIYAAKSTDEGNTWTEIGAVIVRGSQGSFDSNSAFTPNVLKYKEKYYLYYTAVGDGFTNKGYTDFNRTCIGLAVSDSPEGPFKKLKKPVLETTRDNKSFDSFRIDDAALRVVDGKIWLYYKGRSWKNATPNTMMGYAVACKPTGKFKRQNEGQPIQRGGHEVMVWEYKDNVYSFMSKGHGKNSGTYRKAEDGKSFEVENAIISKSPRLRAPGIYRPELTGGVQKESTLWGVHMAHFKGGIWLKRFEIDMKQVDPSLVP